MKNLKKNNALLVAVLVLASCLMIFSGVQTSRAALTLYSGVYVEQIELSQIGVTLMENGEDVAHRDFIGTDDAEHSKKSADQLWDTDNPGVLFTNLLGESEEFKIGKTYDEEIACRNSGAIDEYVRIVLRRYWTDEDGKKLVEQDPTLIKLNPVNDDVWYFNEDESTDEMLVFYYRSLLPAGMMTEPVIDKLSLDEALTYMVTETTYVDEEGFTVIETAFDFDGDRFVLEAEVDAVQNHNADEAMCSAWGLSVNDLR